jgi:hypothetical protein
VDLFSRLYFFKYQHRKKPVIVRRMKCPKTMICNPFTKQSHHGLHECLVVCSVKNPVVNEVPSGYHLCPRLQGTDQYPEDRDGDGSRNIGFFLPFNRLTWLVAQENFIICYIMDWNLCTYVLPCSSICCFVCREHFQHLL